MLMHVEKNVISSLLYTFPSAHAQLIYLFIYLFIYSEFYILCKREAILTLKSA